METTPRVLVLLAEGTEEMEFTIVVDVLRRAGVEVLVGGVDSAETVTCSRGVRIAPDLALGELDRGERFDWIILPGGAGGSDRFAESELVGEWLRTQWSRREDGAGVAAICAAPGALVAHGVGEGLPRTSHPSVSERAGSHGPYEERPVVETEHLITSRGPGTAFAFAFSLVARLRGLERLAEIRAPMIFAD
ncbi:MAG: DJ-1 family glyoxalase III [Planctomycetota bacterium]